MTEVSSIIAAVQIQKAMQPQPAFAGDHLEAVNDLGDRLTIHHESTKQDLSHVRIEGHEGKYVLECDWEVVIRMRGLSLSNVTAKRANPMVVTFQDGSKVSLVPPEYEIDGAMAASKVYRMTPSTSTLEDSSNNVTATVQYLENPKKGGMLSGFFSKPLEIKPSDLNRIKVEIKKDGKVVSTGTGSYTSHLEFDGMLYWKVTDPVPHWDFEHSSITKKMTADSQNLKSLIKQKKFTEAET